ncbi:MAG: tRNA guanosine(34) transglycosylase Tgt [Bacteroidota bacterium]|nr:tRNA guanosine(34) transglycosylase Tgt [Bacteroidota bacterium]
MGEGFFELEHRDRNGRARAGLLRTGHGIVETPVFMPVGTQGAVKAVEHRELDDIGARLILANTYHLALRPGIQVIRDLGGLHRFMNWQGSILTDSGGYQVYSLSQLRRIEPDGVVFRSHIDGSIHRFTPSMVIDVQRVLGSDIMMVLDECPPADCGEEYARRSAALTLRWARESREHAQRTSPLYGHPQFLFGIVQGGVHEHLRVRNAEDIVAVGFDGYAIGGVSVGEPPEVMYRVTEVTASVLPWNAPRYLMGVGTPRDIVEAIGRGIDMFDCVLPTRNGRNGMVFTRQGPLSIAKERYQRDHRPVDEACSCYTCSTFSRAYLCMLFRTREILALQLASLHNLAFYLRLTREARTAILEDRFDEWSRSFIEQYSGGEDGVYQPAEQ